MRFLKRAALVLAVVCLLAVIGAYLVLNSPRLTGRLAEYALERAMKDYKVSSLHIGQQRFAPPNYFHFKDVKIVLQKKGETPEEIAFAELEFQVHSNSFFVYKLRSLSMNRSKIRFQDAHLSGKVRLEDPFALSGRILIPELEISGFKFKEVASTIVTEEDRIVLPDINGQCYAGTVSGKISVAYRPLLRYDMNLTFEGLDPGELRSFNEAIFSKMTGVLDGSVQIRIAGNKVESLTTDWKMSRNPQIKAPLLKFLMEYLPNTEEKKKVEQLIQEDGMIDVNIAAMNFEKVKDDTLKGNIDLYSKALNLKSNHDLTVKLDATLEDYAAAGISLITALNAYLNSSL